LVYSLLYLTAEFAENAEKKIMGLLILQRNFLFNWVSTFVGAASSRDDRRQQGVTWIFAAGSRSHQVKAVFL
jgi:hypothetical protein